MDWLLPAFLHGTDPRRNTSEAQGACGCALASAGGLALRAAIRRSVAEDLAGAGVPQDVGQPAVGYDAAGRVVREMSPLYKPPSGTKSHPGYRDLFGAFATRAAITIPIIAATRYKGQLPLDEQPILEKPKPWADPTRGLP